MSFSKRGNAKVVEKGSCAGIFINTARIGVVETKLHLSADQARPGDAVLLSGPQLADDAHHEAAS